MQVMNSAELTQNDILVGNKAVTRSFGVSDDPMLMSMLSTGFYQNPLRTMIQEVMFNAWDAHRMGNCQHRPIDIYVNDTTGLIIRDYGPGIEPGENDDNMHDIYCMYGGSTKRGQKNQTGGFGLGSKSPFAYTESFTVTSFFGGTKNMYLISRVSETNGGKPGMTSLVRVPTTETGLMVTVPLKTGHHHKLAYDYIKDILFLSGIKAMVHYMDEPDEFIDSLILPAGSYITDDNHCDGKVWAVYGGVRYLIPKNEEYENEHEFMCLLGNRKDIFVGFAPDTLTPLPNREGLNMGEKSKETVKATFERCTEKFQTTFETVAKSFFHRMFIHLKANGIQPQFAFIKAAEFGMGESASAMRIALMLEILKDCPDSLDPDIWKIATELVIHQTDSIRNFIGNPRWKTMFIRAFVEAFPNNRYIAWAALKDKKILIHRDSSYMKEFLTEMHAARFLRDQDTFIREMQKAFPNDNALIPQMRICHGDDFELVSRERTKANLNQTKYGFAGLKSDDPKLKRKDAPYPHLEQMYRRKDGKPLDFLMMNKMVLVAKTLTTLKNSKIPDVVTVNKDVLSHSWHYHVNVTCLIPGYVVYERKGAYEKAVEILTNLGFIVVEGDEPEKKVYVPKAKTVSMYSKMNPQNSDTWQSMRADEQFTDPTHFYYATLTTIRGYGSHNRPNHTLVNWFLKKNPKTVTVTNNRTAENLQKQGALPLHEGVIKWYETASADTDRMQNIIRASQIALLANFPSDMLRHPLMQLELGMEPVDCTDEEFWYESEGYNLLSSTRYHPLQAASRNVKVQLETLWRTDPERRNIEKMCLKTKIFGFNPFFALWSSTNVSDQDAVVEKIIAAMKPFS